MNSEEFGSLNILKLKYGMGGPNNSNFLQNWFPPEITSPFFNLQNFQDPKKRTSESSRIH